MTTHTAPANSWTPIPSDVALTMGKAAAVDELCSRCKDTFLPGTEHRCPICSIPVFD